MWYNAMVIMEQIDDRTDHIMPKYKIKYENNQTFLAIGKFLLCFSRLKKHREKVPGS